MGLYDELRRVAVAALRTNHRGYKQVRGKLKGYLPDDRCATGLVAEALHIPLDDYMSAEHQVGNKLGDPGVASVIIGMNDGDGRSFKEIADYLEKRWGL